MKLYLIMSPSFNVLRRLCTLFGVSLSPLNSR